MATREHRCGDCGVREGQLHRPNCDMEVCPFCGGQLLSCDCCYALLGIDCSPGTWAYKHGLTQEQEDQWFAMLEVRGRIPYIEYPIFCARCGKLWPDFFMVSNEEWKKYIQIDKRGEVICRECYNTIKGYIDALPKKEMPTSKNRKLSQADYEEILNRQTEHYEGGGND